MTPISPQKINAILSRHAEAEARLSSGTLAPPEFVALSKELAELEPVVRAACEVVRLRDELAELEALLADPEMKAMADEELPATEAALCPRPNCTLAIALLP